MANRLHIATDNLLACTQAIARDQSLISAHQVQHFALGLRSCYPMADKEVMVTVVASIVLPKEKQVSDISWTTRSPIHVRNDRSIAKRDKIIRSTRCATRYSHARAIDSPVTSACLFVARDCGESRRNVGWQDTCRSRLLAWKMLMTFTTILLCFRKCFERESSSIRLFIWIPLCALNQSCH